MIRRFLLSLLLLVTCLTAAPLTANAGFDPFGHACTKETQGSRVCQTDAGSDAVVSDGPKVLLLNITDIVAYIAGALAIIMIIVGGLRFITAGSDVSTGSRTDTDIEDAKRSIGAALIGLVVIVLAKTIITFVITRL